MPTARHSSLWDRLTGDETTFTQENFDAWGLDPLNYPTQFEVVDGSHTYPFRAAYTWRINPMTLINVIYQWISAEGGVTAQQGRDAFSLSDHEALQIDDIRTYIDTPPQSEAKLDRFMVIKGFTYLVEQRHPLVTKTVFYNKFGIRDDAPSG